MKSSDDPFRSALFKRFASMNRAGLRAMLKNMGSSGTSMVTIALSDRSRYLDPPKVGKIMAQNL